MKLALYIANVMAFAAAVAWLMDSPTWEPLITVLTLSATLLGVITMRAKGKSPGRGGNAIVAGETSAVHLENQGIVKAGKGGTGGSGGDAIHVAPGVKVTIINGGVIAGGDAGNFKSGKGNS